MNGNRRSVRTWLATSCLVALVGWTTAAPPVGGTFTYQGSLTDAGVPANGPYDFVFTVFDAEVGGTQQAPSVTINDLPVTNGLFTAELNFLSIDYLQGIWLEIAVRPGPSTDPHTTLSGRTYIHPTPAAMLAINARTIAGLAPEDFAAAEHTHAALHTPDGSLEVVTITPTGTIELPGATTLSGPSDGVMRLGLDGPDFSGVLEVFSDLYFGVYNRVGISTGSDSRVFHLLSPDVTDDSSRPSDVWISTGSSLGTADFNVAGDLALGTGKSEYGHGGVIYMLAGDGKSGANGGGNGGDILIEAGDGLGNSSSSRGGTVSIKAGNTEEGTPGDVVVRAGGRYSDLEFGFIWLDAAYTWIRGRGTSFLEPIFLPPAALYVTGGDTLLSGNLELWEEEPVIKARDGFQFYQPGTLTVRGGDFAESFNPTFDAGDLVLRGGSHTLANGGSSAGGEVTISGGDGATTGLAFDQPGGSGGDVVISGGASSGNEAPLTPRRGGHVFISGGEGASLAEEDRGHVFIQGLVSINRGSKPPEVGTVLQVGNDPNDGNGAHVTPGGMWVSTSDRATKTDLESIDPRKVLQGVLDLPLLRWRYDGEPGAVRHLGPMAQDFHAAFGLGSSDRHIGMVDADGVALAAIQGLHAEANERLQALEDENRQLRERLQALEQAIQGMRQ